MPDLNPFSHLDTTGEVRMVDVGGKPDQHRRAVAEGFIRCAAATMEKLKQHALPKGDVLTTAKIAGIQGGKATSTLIPLCHPLPLHVLDLTFTVEVDGVRIQATAETRGKTGVEMEALTAVSIAALTIYDMCKAVDKSMVIEGITLLEKMKQ